MSCFFHCTLDEYDQKQAILCGILFFLEAVSNLSSFSLSHLLQLRHAPIVKVLYKQANIGFAAEAVFFGGGKGGVSPQKRV